jgi:hypothetical protein
LASQNTQKLQKFSKFVLGEQSGSFGEKITGLNNFSTVQPIFTSTPIDSAKKGNKLKSLKLSKFHSRGTREQFS